MHLRVSVISTLCEEKRLALIDPKQAFMGLLTWPKISNRLVIILYKICQEFSVFFLDDILIVSKY